MTERKNEILIVAQKAFRKKGYDSASMRDIAKACGLEPASLYSHFTSKEEMLQTICFDLADKFKSVIGEVNDIYFNAEQRISMVIEAHIGVLTENLDSAVVFLRDWRYLSKDALAKFIKQRDEYEQGIVKIIENGISEDKFSETDSKFATLTILSSVNWIVEWYNPKGNLTTKEIGNKLSSFILSGLKK